MRKLTLISQDCGTLTLIGEDCSTLTLIGQTKYLQPTNQSLDLRCKHFHYSIIARIFFNKQTFFLNDKILKCVDKSSQLEAKAIMKTKKD